MIFHKFGKEDKPLIVFIHGAFQPWQSILPTAKHFEEDYHVVIPALNSHTSEMKTEFISIKKEAEEIENYITSNYGGEVFALCGLSMGGAIAYTILANQKLKIKNVILDGAPLVPAGSMLKSIMTNNYLAIAEKSKARDKKTLKNFGKNFLPEKYLDDYLAFIDNTSNESIKNMIASVSNVSFSTDINLENTKLMYIHGTKANEYLAKKSARLIARHYIDAYVITFKGDRHCQCAIYEPDDWAEVAKDFFLNR